MLQWCFSQTFCVFLIAIQHAGQHKIPEVFSECGLPLKARGPLLTVDAVE